MGFTDMLKNVVNNEENNSTDNSDVNVEYNKDLSLEDNIKAAYNARHNFKDVLKILKPLSFDMLEQNKDKIIEYAKGMLEKKGFSLDSVKSGADYADFVKELAKVVMEKMKNKDSEIA